MYETKPYFYGTGRRKDSVARVRVYQALARSPSTTVTSTTTSVWRPEADRPLSAGPAGPRGQV